MIICIWYRFKGNKDLLLRGLSFFGPHEKTPEIKSKFMVTIQIWVSPVGGQTPMTKPFFEENYTVEAWRGKKFSIEFQKPVVFIAKHTWVDIRFQLDVSILRFKAFCTQVMIQLLIE